MEAKIQAKTAAEQRTATKPKKPTDGTDRTMAPSTSASLRNNYPARYRPPLTNHDLRRTFIERTFTNDAGADVVGRYVVTWWCAGCNEQFQSEATSHLHKRSCAGDITTSYTPAESLIDCVPSKRMRRKRENVGSRAVVVGQPVPSLCFDCIPFYAYNLCRRKIQLLSRGRRR